MAFLEFVYNLFIDIISKDIISLNEHHSQSVIIPVSSIQITTETNINACEFENYEGKIYYC